MCELPGEANIVPGVTVALIMLPDPIIVTGPVVFCGEQADNKIRPTPIIKNQ
jgi:hypothetical protein